MVEILAKEKQILEYLVFWKSGERQWILEKNVEDTKLLVKFLKNVEDNLPMSHNMIQLLLDAIKLFIKELESLKNKLSLAAAKWCVNGWIEQGAFLQSS